MLEAVPGLHKISLPLDIILAEEEVIAIVDDDATIRERICERMPHFGLELDHQRNQAPEQWQGDISTDASRVRALVIPTNEELAIARHTAALLAEKNA